jgi:predicted negative regulator of RcsB-dependent stress response
MEGLIILVLLLFAFMFGFNPKQEKKKDIIQEQEYRKILKKMKRKHNIRIENKNSIENGDTYKNNDRNERDCD